MTAKPAFSFGLKASKTNLPAKNGLRAPQRKPNAFGGGDNDSDDDDAQTVSKSTDEQIITEFDDSIPTSTSPSRKSALSKKLKSTTRKSPPRLKSKSIPSDEFTDLSSALTSRKYAETAQQLDSTVYDYDTVYDSLKAAQRQREEAAAAASANGGKSRYMADVAKAATLRERDRALAELRKTQREREAEGQEFADKEAFVTEGYKKKQEENRLAEEEEKRREEAEAKKNKMGGMIGLRKDLLAREDQRHVDVLRAEEEAKRRKEAGVAGPVGEDGANDENEDADLATLMNGHGAHIEVNEDGEVVDKRELLRGGLNLGSRKQTDSAKQAEANRRAAANGSGPQHRSQGIFNAGGKVGMRERQTRMMEEQLLQASKRAREEEDEERQKVEEAAKSRKTDGEVSSAKERYLARKRAQEEEKRKEAAGS